jgi:hypothetical protein
MLMWVLIGFVVVLVLVILTTRGTSGAEIIPTNPVTGNRVIQKSAMVVFMQPSEEKGTYKYRKVEMPACEVLAKHCLTANDLYDPEGGLPLKWGEHVYFGRISLPAGVQVTLKALGPGNKGASSSAMPHWNGYCDSDRTDGIPPLVIQGPTGEHDFWDYDLRYCCMIFSLIPGYECATS